MSPRTITHRDGWALALIKAMGLDETKVIDVHQDSAHPGKVRVTFLDSPGWAPDWEHGRHDEWLPIPDGWQWTPPAAPTAPTKEPGRLWRVVTPDWSLWCETSDEAEARAAVRPGDTLWREWVIPAVSTWEVAP